MAGVTLDHDEATVAEADSGAKRSQSAVALPASPRTSITVRQALPTDLTSLRHVLRTCGLAADQDLSIITGGVVLVAERRGQIMGMIQCLLGFPCAYVSYFAVLPEARAQGRTAHALITGLEDTLRSLSIPSWLANIADDDPAWQRTVTRWGARPTPRPMTLYRKEL